MEVNFETKEESNARREQAFLALSGAERISSFLRLMEQVDFFPVKMKLKEKDNYVIRISHQDGLGK